MFSYYKTVHGTSQEKIFTIEELVEFIKDHPRKKLIEELRREEYKSVRYDQIKEQLPCVTPAGIFKDRRTKTEILHTSGYMFFDIDMKNIKGDLLSYKDHVFINYKKYISLLGISAGGRGLFFYIKLNGITEENYDKLYEYFRTIIFKELDPDNNAKGINRAHIIPYDPDLYYNSNVILTIPECISVISEKNIYSIENRTFNIEISKKRCYTLKVQLLPIDQVLNMLRIETEVKVTGKLFEIDPVDHIKLFVPEMIEDGDKHKTFRRITQVLLYLNPDVELQVIQSYINYINKNHTTREMKFMEMMRTVEHCYRKTKESGAIDIPLRTKTLHFNKSLRLHGDYKRQVAARVNGLIKIFKSVALIDSTKKQLEAEGKKITKKLVTEMTGLCYKTVSRNWEISLIEIMDKINDCNQDVDNGLLDTQNLDEIINEYERKEKISETVNE